MPWFTADSSGGRSIRHQQLQSTNLLAAGGGAVGIAVVAEIVCESALGIADTRLKQVNHLFFAQSVTAKAFYPSLLTVHISVSSAYLIRNATRLA